MAELALTNGYFEASPDAVVVTDAGGLIVHVNAQAEALFGYPRAELIGRSVDLLVPERFAGGHSALRQGYVAKPRNRPMGTGQILFARRKDGSELAVEISLGPFTADGSRNLYTQTIQVTDALIVVLDPAWSRAGRARQMTGAR